MNRIMYAVVTILGCAVLCNSKLYDRKEHKVRPVSEETVNNEKQQVINRHTIRLRQNPNLQTTDMQVSVVSDIEERLKRNTIEHPDGVDNTDEQYKEINDKQFVLNNNNVEYSSDQNGLNTEKLQANTNVNDAVSILAQKQDRFNTDSEPPANSRNETNEKHKRSTDQDAINTAQSPKLNSLIFKHFGPEKRPNEPSTNKPSMKTENTIHEHPATLANNTNNAAGISTRVIEETAQKVPDTNGWQAKKTSGFVYIAYSVAFLVLSI